MGNKFQELAFTPAVKAAQEKYGSRSHFDKIEKAPDRNFALGDAETDFIQTIDGFYMATVGEGGRPYIQFRGGQPGFLKVLDERNIGWADFRGNLQYISVGNLGSNAKAALFLMDYANRRRLKIFATANVYDAADRPDLIEKLAVSGYKAKVERAIVLTIEGFDWNCPQHINPKYSIEQVRELVRPMTERIEVLERQLAELRHQEK